jgi:uncharacterized protein YecE (DUF72 family)
MNSEKAGLYIGTSNVVLPGNKLTFSLRYRNKSRLHYYASVFNSVEINSSFYKLPQPKTFKRWAEETNAHFKFSLKLSREITHNNKPVFDVTVLRNFLTAGNQLQAKKGCLLIQLPGKAGLDHYNKLENILKSIRQYDAEPRWKLAVEFRNDQWYIKETTELLREYDASMVMHDIPKGKNDTIIKNAAFAYIRFHGIKGDYRGSYPDDLLIKYALKVKQLLSEELPVYIYFNNTIGDAYKNAVRMKEILNNE